MIDALASHIAEELSLQAASVLRTLALLDDGNTIPFIARYRKEVTGGLDEVQIAAIAKRAESLRALEARRAEVRRLIEEQGALTGALAAAPPHRILAINRGEREGALRVSVETPEDQALGVLARHYPADDRSSLAGDLRRAAADGLERLLAPSLEPEMRADLTGRAEAHAIGVFAANQRPLLLQPPLRGRTVIGIDPGYRTGCKVAVVDETAWVLATGTIFHHPPQARRDEAKAALRDLVRAHGATVFAVGNGVLSLEDLRVGMVLHGAQRRRFRGLRRHRAQALGPGACLRDGRSVRAVAARRGQRRQIVSVRVVSVDAQRGRIGLSMRPARP